MPLSTWFSKLFRRQTVKAPSTSFSSLMRGGQPPRTGAPEVLYAYDRLPRLRAVVDRVARSVASARWRAYRASPMEKSVKLEEWKSLDPDLRTVQKAESALRLPRIEEHPSLTLLRRGNGVLSARQIRELTQIYLDLLGEAFWRRTTSGSTTVSLFPLPPTWIKEVPTRERNRFKIQIPSGPSEDVAAEQMYWLRVPSPSDPYGRGSGVGRTLGDELATDEYAAQTSVYRFFNKATPDVLVSLKGMGEDEIEAYAIAWDQRNRGMQKIGRPHFTNADVSVNPLDSKIVDMDLVSIRKFEADVIRQTFGVPPEILGDVSNSNRATVSMAQYLYALNVLVPRLDLMQDFFNETLLPSIGYDDVIFLYDSPVPTDHETVMQILDRHPWVFSMNEIREVMKVLPVDQVAGEMHFRADGTVLDLDDPKGSEPSVVSAAPVASAEDEDSDDAQEASDVPSEED